MVIATGKPPTKTITWKSASQINLKYQLLSFSRADILILVEWIEDFNITG